MSELISRDSAPCSNQNGPVIHCADCGFYEELDGVKVCKIWYIHGKEAKTPETGFCFCAIKREEFVEWLETAQALLKMG